ncbi:Uncharacterized protein HZ326_14570 [Fusarium oxysporum f. sp. albedinis]|nr:Uncharacterized protein HZ326_14570 [Fusarium oxysporum f. sp. albedinis]
MKTKSGIRVLYRFTINRTSRPITSLSTYRYDQPRQLKSRSSEYENKTYLTTRLTSTRRRERPPPYLDGFTSARLVIDHKQPRPGSKPINDVLFKILLCQGM